MTDITQDPYRTQAMQSSLQPKTKTAYDLQRERIKAEQQDEDAGRREAMQRQLATQGLKAGSGLAEKQMREADIEARIQQARKLGSVDIAESQANEVSQEAEKQRKFLTGERTGTQDFTSRENALNRYLQEKQITGNLSIEQQKVANQAAQFGSEQEFKKYALEAGLSDEQANRAWQSQESEKQRASTEELAYAGLNLEEKKLAQQAGQFATEDQFKRYALERGFDESSAQRTWQGYQNTLERKQSKELAYANLSLEEKKLAQQAGQFENEQAFKKYALESGYDEAAAQRIWQSYESSKERQSTEKVAFAGLSLKEKELAQQAMQFDSKLEFDTWAKSADLTQEERERTWQAAQNEKQRTSTENIAYAGLNLEEKKLAQQAGQFESEQAFKKYALESGYDEAAAQRIWQSYESGKQRTATKELATMDQNTQLTLERMRAQFEAGNLRLQDSLAQDKEVRVAQAKQYYDMGAASNGVDAQDYLEKNFGISLDQLRINNPLAYSAFIDGQSGKSLEESQRDYEEKIDKRNALIASVDPADPGFISKISQIFNSGTYSNTPSLSPVDLDAKAMSLVDRLIANGKIPGGATISATMKSQYAQQIKDGYYGDINSLITQYGV